MKKTLLAISLLAAFSYAEEKKSDAITSKKLKNAEYTIYSGELGNEKPPTKAERKLSIEISGDAAKDLFESIYPDSHATCSGEKDERLRRKGDFWCIHTSAAGYRCFLGFNLRTGTMIPGGSC